MPSNSRLTKKKNRRLDWILTVVFCEKDVVFYQAGPNNQQKFKIRDAVGDLPGFFYAECGRGANR
jgi:hypothetical protein